jgi:hypothetical protein
MRTRMRRVCARQPSDLPLERWRVGMV